MDTEKKEFYTVAEVAKLLNVTENTIRLKINEKKLKAYKKLNKWYIFKEDLEKFIKS